MISVDVGCLVSHTPTNNKLFSSIFLLEHLYNRQTKLYVISNYDYINRLNKIFCANLCDEKVLF